jgi:HEAT repeat protein
MYVDWKMVLVLAVLGVGGYFAYQQFWVGARKLEKATTAELMGQYETAAAVDREMIHLELKSRSEKPGKLDAGALAEWVKKKEPALETYAAACEMLGRIHDRKMVDALIKDLQHSNLRVRAGATRYFQHAPAQRAFEPLVKNLDQANDDVRKGAIAALENLADLTTTGVRFKADPAKWREWWIALPKAEKAKIPE